MLSAPRVICTASGFHNVKALTGACRPASARLTMAIAHRGWLTADRELNRAAKAAAFVGFSVTHDAPPC